MILHINSTIIRHTLVLLSILSTSLLFGQYIRYSPIDEDDVSPWATSNLTEYYGAYDFGDSDGESTLLLFDTGTEIIAQIKTSVWGSDIVDSWVPKRINLSNVTIDRNGKFSSDQYHGEFVNYHGNGKALKCLKIYNSWSGDNDGEGEYELGVMSYKNLYERHISGKYAFASTRDLDPKELKKMRSNELQIMRNEIFARYSYKFREGGKMEAYFKQQKWYYVAHTKVDNFLTTVEKRNIKRIRAEEKQRSNTKR